MAFTSLVGVATKQLTGGLQPGVFENWLAAAPVVCLGAPLGVFAVNLLGRKPTLLFVAALCIAQFVWTCQSEYQRIGPVGVLAALGTVGLCLLGFEKLRSCGAALVGENTRQRPPATPVQIAPHESPSKN